VGSDAIAVSPDGKNLYVASRRSHAIAVFGRNLATGTLTQAPGPAGCVAAGGAEGCGPADGVGGPVSVAVSPDGKNVYAASMSGSSLAIFRRNPSTGALTQLKGTAGCVAKKAGPGCASARGLNSADVVQVSPDGKNVYAGAFLGAAVVAFSRDPSTGALTPLPGESGCIAAAIAGCAKGIATHGSEGLAVSADGKNVYVAAFLSSAVDVFTRNAATGALTQAKNGTGCLTGTPQSGCRAARALKGAESALISPNDRTVYITAGISSSVVILTRALRSGDLTQAIGPLGCVQNKLLNGCAPGRPLFDPEGLAISPNGANVYAAVYAGSALDTFNRNHGTGALTQKPGRPGCLTSRALRGCARAHGGVRGAGSAVVSPDGKYLYAAAELSNSLTVYSITSAGSDHR
jgi:DNA-binding beta-propeller fold protein YncE